LHITPLDTKPLCLPHNFANIVEKNKESMKNKKNGINFALCKTAKKSLPNAVSGALV